MKDISRAALNAVLDELRVTGEGAAFARVCERPLARDATGETVSAKTVEIIDRLLVGFLNHPGTSSETRALVAMAHVRLHATTEPPPPTLAETAPRTTRAPVESAAAREPPQAPEASPRVSTDRLHALIARGLRVLAGTTNPAAPESGDARGKSADTKSSREVSAKTPDARAGLLDRRSLLKLIKTESDRANRYGQPLSLGLIVVRDLEVVRAERGVASRDAVLRAYVRYMENGFRSCDVIARIATNQFVVVFPHTAGEGASGALDKLHEATRGATIAAGNARMVLPEFSARPLAYREKESADEFLSRARALLNEMSVA